MFNKEFKELIKSIVNKELLKELVKSITLLSQRIDQFNERQHNEFEWFRAHIQLVTKNDLKEMEKRLMMTQQQLGEALDKMTTQSGKIAKEQSDRFDALTKAIKELNDQIATGETVTPEVEEKQAKLQTALDNMDAAIPDAPTPT